MALTPYPNPVRTSVGTTAELSQVVDNDLNDGEWAYTRTGKAYYSLDKGASSGVPTKSGQGFWVLYVPLDADAVLFDGLGPPANLRSDRMADQSPIDNTKVGIVNLSSDTTGSALGATANYATIGGGNRNEATGNNSTVPGGFHNRATARDATVAGGNANQAIGSTSTVGGGESNIAGGPDSVIAGGSGNQSAGLSSAVCGGANSLASGNYAFVGGGFACQAAGVSAVVGGGDSNTASGDYSSVCGGSANSASGTGSSAGGLGAIASRNGQRAWSSNGVAVSGTQTSDVTMDGVASTGAPSVALQLMGVANLPLDPAKSYIIVLEAVAKASAPGANQTCVFRQTLAFDGPSAMLSAGVQEQLSIGADAANYTLIPTAVAGPALVITVDTSAAMANKDANITALVRFTETV